jgi:hypothetical protein
LPYPVAIVAIAWGIVAGLAGVFAINAPRFGMLRSFCDLGPDRRNYHRTQPQTLAAKWTKRPARLTADELPCQLRGVTA